jgi:hypothetical protein
MRKRLLSAGAALVTLFAVLMSGPGTVSAATPGAAAGFAARAQAAGLPAAQVQSTQRQVQAFIKRYGGRQVALNLVVFRGGSMLFAVPGREASAVANASAGTRVAAVVSSTCPVTAFCAWGQIDYAGSRAAFYACGIDYTNPWAGVVFGSWKNDQTPQGPSGPRVKFLYSDKTVVATTPPPWAGNTEYYWNNVYYFRVC